MHHMPCAGPEALLMQTCANYIAKKCRFIKTKRLQANKYPGYPWPSPQLHRGTIRSPEIDAQGLGSQHRRQAPGVARIICQHVVTLKACSPFAAKLRKALEIQGFPMFSRQIDG